MGLKYKPDEQYDEYTRKRYKKISIHPANSIAKNAILERYFANDFSKKKKDGTFFR